MRKVVSVILVASVCFVLVSEIIARSYLGLGTPPLSVTHPTIEYMFKPNQDLFRFGNHIFINEFGMRSDPLSKAKTDPNEFRLMMIGDSIINGSNLTDQTELASEIIEKSLTSSLHRPVTVGNISAGSWGPANMLAYVNEYGLFDADMVVLVLSSHDYADVPTFEPLNPNTHPTATPLLALSEGFTRYLPRYIPSFIYGSTSPDTQKPPRPPSEERIRKATAAFSRLLTNLQNEKLPVIFVQHMDREEAQRNIRKPGFKILRELASDYENLIVVDDYRVMAEGDNPYRDNIHPGPEGQTILAKLILTTLAKQNLTHKKDLL